MITGPIYRYLQETHPKHVFKAMGSPSRMQSNDWSELPVITFYHQRYKRATHHILLDYYPLLTLSKIKYNKSKPFRDCIKALIEIRTIDLSDPDSIEELDALIERPQ